jgi:hypothetical protein
MSILQKIKCRSLSKTLAAVVTGSVLFFSAGDVQASADAEAKFRQAYLSEPQTTRSFNQNIDFFSPTFHADVDSYGTVVSDATMQMTGKLNWAYTNPVNNNTINFDIPFYITQDGNSEMVLYVQRNGAWTRFLLPGMPSSFVNALKTTNNSILRDNMKAVRNVELFSETNAQQIFLVTLDGNYLAQLMADYSRNRSGDSISTRENHEFFSRNLQAALRKTDVHCTWTFDKINNHTLTAVIDFTELLRAYSVSVLNESAAGVVVLSEEDRRLFETVGYYSECHYTLSYIAGDLETQTTPPAEARRAPASRDIFDDLVREMVTTVRRK